MIFPTCEKVTDNGFGSNCYINIAYNQQLPLCASSSPSAKQRNCRTPDELCTADPNFKFDMTAESKVGREISLEHSADCLWMEVERIGGLSLVSDLRPLPFHGPLFNARAGREGRDLRPGGAVVAEDGRLQLG